MHKACDPDAAAKGKRGASRKAVGKKAKKIKPPKTPRIEVGATITIPRPAKRARVYPVDPPTDLESDEMAAAVKDAGRELATMGKRVVKMAENLSEMGSAMERFGAAVWRMGEALDKHDL
jgi:hypothetical protein